jgi:hypothetical protein
MTVEDALADYAEGYDVGDEPCAITFRWDLWEDGRLFAIGRVTFRFTSPQPPPRGQGNQR